MTATLFPGEPLGSTLVVYKGFPAVYLGPDPVTDGRCARVLYMGSVKVVAYPEIGYAGPDEYREAV